MERVRGGQVRWVAQTTLGREVRFGFAALAAGFLLGAVQVLLSR